MPRVKRSVHARKKRRKVRGQAKGYWGLKKSSYRYAKEQVEHSLHYAYRDRKNKKRTFRRLWIIRINAAARQNGMSYNQLMAGLRRAEIPLDRKVLAGVASWDDPLEEHGDFLRAFVRDRFVQTNEVQRAWVLLPCFLRAAQLLDVAELDVVELGASAGLNLV